HADRRGPAEPRQDPGTRRTGRIDRWGRHLRWHLRDRPACRAVRGTGALRALSALPVFARYLVPRQHSVSAQVFALPWTASRWPTSSSAQFFRIVSTAAVSVTLLAGCATDSWSASASITRARMVS